MKRSYAISLLALVVGGFGLIVSYGNSWLLVTSPVLGSGGAGIGSKVTAITGSAVSAGAGVMGLVSLILAGLLLVTRGIVRRVLGALAVLAGSYAALTALWFAVTREVPAWVVAEVGEATGTEWTLWWLGAAASGGVVAFGGALALARGHRFSTFSSRYDRGRAPTSTWDALDHGIDPTDDAGGDSSPAPHTPGPPPGGAGAP